MKRKLAISLLIAVVITLGGSIVILKTFPNVKKQLYKTLNIRRGKKDQPKIDYEISPNFIDKPDVIGKAPTFNLLDENGLTFDDKNMMGSISIIHFLDLIDSVKAIKQIALIKNLNDRLAKYPLWNDVSFISIIADSESATSKYLDNYLGSDKPLPNNWKILSGNKSAVSKLKTNGIIQNGNGDNNNDQTSIRFSSDFTLVDRKGNIRGYYHGSAEDSTHNLLKDIVAVIVEKEGKLVVPETIITPIWLDDRKEKQMSTLGQFDVFHDFQFKDQLESSNINFKHQITAIGGRKMKAVHYDHGNGMAVADVDKDGLLDILFISQIGRNQLWRNIGNGKFEDITALSVDLAMRDIISVAVSFADIDNDDDPDIYISTVRDGNRLFENIGNGKFKDISQAANVDHKGHSSGTVFFDYNNDGLLDLFVTNVGQYTIDEKVKMTVSDPYDTTQNGVYSYYEPVQNAFEGHLLPERAERSILFKNLGGNKFKDVSKESGIDEKGWNGDASPIDLNNDGLMDLYITNMQGEDRFYLNIDGNRFEEKTKMYFPKTSWGAMGIKSMDYNNDSFMDLYITDMHSDMGKYIRILPDDKLEKVKGEFFYSLLQTKDTIMGNSFFENDGNGGYKEVSKKVNAENFWPWGLSTGDLNADGYEDAFLTSSMNYQFRYAVNSLMLNNKGEKFLDSEFILGVEPRADGITAKYWFDLDCSGDDKDHEYCIDKQGKYEMWGTMGSRSSAIFDIDNDGDLDILTSEYNAKPMVLISDLQKQKENLNFIKIKLRGNTSSRDGLGAKVTLKSTSLTQTKVNDGKSGYLSQSSYPLYFGLGDDEEILEIRILWPGGKEQIIMEGIILNDLFVIEEL